VSEEVVMGFTLGHLAAAYVVGSAAAVMLFRTWVKEKIVTATLDTLIEQGYLISWIDEQGVTQLSKWGDLQDLEKSMLDMIDDMDPAEIDKILDEMIQEDKEKNETDDTP
jgi:hypothetical protein